MEPLPSDVHIGFRKVRGCTDAIFVLLQQSEKAIECNRELNIVFVDQVKAFDRVNRDKPCTVLETILGQLPIHLRQEYELSPHSKRNHILVPSYIWNETKVYPITTAVHCVRGQDNIGPNPQQEALNESVANEDEKKLQKHENSLTTATKWFMRMTLDLYSSPLFSNVR